MMLALSPAWSWVLVVVLALTAIALGIWGAGEMLRDAMDDDEEEDNDA